LTSSTCQGTSEVRAGVAMSPCPPATFCRHHIQSRARGVLSVRQLSASLNWEVQQEIATLVGRDGIRRGCFIVLRENTQLLGITVCFQLLSQHRHRENEEVRTTRTPILQTRQNWHCLWQNWHWHCHLLASNVCQSRGDVTHHAALQPGVFCW
jgi:hypothetical protein